MEYNTNREQLNLPEYGRHIHRMVQHLNTIEDPEKRQKNAELIIDLMGILNPHLQIVEDFRHILWNHLFVIADYNLNIQSPYPQPTKEENNSKPAPFSYPNTKPKFKHLGKNLSTIINKAIAETDEEKKQGFINTIVHYMKLSYVNWHYEMPHDHAIAEELKEISDGKLIYDGGDIKIRVNTSHSNNTKKRSKGKVSNNRSYKKSSNRKSKFN